MIYPMMTIADQSVIKNTITAQPRDAVFVEFGTGGSTIMFAQHLTHEQQLIAVEHNVEWYHKVKDELAQLPEDQRSRVSLYLKTPDAELSFYPFGNPYEETPYACADYIHAQGVPIPWERVSVVLVDGFVRGAVLAVLRTKLRPATTVFLHDWTGREDWYEWATRLYITVGVPCGMSAGYTEDGHPFPNTLLILRTPGIHEMLSDNLVLRDQNRALAQRVKELEASARTIVVATQTVPPMDAMG